MTSRGQRKLEAVRRHTIRAWVDGRITTEDATGMLAIDEAKLRRLADEMRLFDDRARRPFTDD